MQLQNRSRQLAAAASNIHHSSRQSDARVDPMREYVLLSKTQAQLLSIKGMTSGFDTATHSRTCAVTMVIILGAMPSAARWPVNFGGISP
jgi:hypothetical protein